MTAKRQAWAGGLSWSARKPGRGETKDADHQAGHRHKGVFGPAGHLGWPPAAEARGWRASLRQPRQAPERGQEQLAEAQHQRRGSHGRSVPAVLVPNTQAALR